MSFNIQKKSQLAIDIKNSSIPLDRVAVIVLGGGAGTRLQPLTTTRCKPVVSFGGRYSLIDVPISHSLSSGLTNIFVLGQYMAYSLQKHLSNTYLNYGANQQRIQLLVPEQRGSELIWFKGTADAVRQNLNYFADVDADYFLILSGDQLYNINFQEMIQFAARTDAGMLLAAQPVNKKDATRMGLLRIEQGTSRLIDFYEKPQDDQTLERFHTDLFTMSQLGLDIPPDKSYLGSMGIYLFKRESLFSLLKEDPREDFGKHLIATQMRKRDAHVFLYDGYWEDIGTVDSYYTANLALTSTNDDVKSGLVWHDEKNMIITKSYDLPGAQINNCRVNRSLLCEGSIINAEEVDHSIVGVRSILGERTRIQDSILMGNEYYRSGGRSPIIGENCLISKAIIDENVSIGNNVRLVNEGRYENYDTPDGLISVRDGITIVPRGTTIPANYSF